MTSKLHQSSPIGVVVSSFKVTKVGYFMRFSLLTFSGSRVEEDPQGFIDEMEKIFKVMHMEEIEGVELDTYQLKDVA